MFSQSWLKNNFDIFKDNITMLQKNKQRYICDDENSTASKSEAHWLLLLHLVSHCALNLKCCEMWWLLARSPVVPAYCPIFAASFLSMGMPLEKLKLGRHTPRLACGCRLPCRLSRSTSAVGRPARIAVQYPGARTLDPRLDQHWCRRARYRRSSCLHTPMGCPHRPTEEHTL